MNISTDRILFLHYRMMKHVYSFFTICCFLIVIVPVSFGQTGEGESFARDMITVDERSGDIPKIEVDKFLSSIGKIENSQFVRVPFAKMSNWRKSRFQEAIQQWILTFPEEDYRVDVIMGAHDTQILQQIVQLFIVVPLPIDDPQRHAARKQLKEIQTMVDGAVWTKFERWFRDTYPSLDSDFIFDIKEKRAFVNINDEEDDLNPFQCYPLKESVFKELKQSVEKILADSAVSINEIDERHIPELLKRLNDVEGVEKESLLNNVKDFTCNWLLNRFGSDVSSKVSPLLNEFTNSAPRNVLNAYKVGYVREISTLVDAKAFEGAFDMRKKIDMEKIAKWHKDRKDEFDMLVASQKEHVNNEPVYEVTKRSFSAGKIVLMVVVNTILITVLAVLLFLHFKKRRAE